MLLKMKTLQHLGSVITLVFPSTGSVKSIISSESRPVFWSNPGSRKYPYKYRPWSILQWTFPGPAESSLYDTHKALSHNSTLMSVMVSSEADFEAIDLRSLVAMRALGICSRPIIHISLAMAILLLRTAQMNTSRNGLFSGSKAWTGFTRK